jgi:transposase
LAQADSQLAKMAALEATITELDGKLSAALQTVEKLQRQLFGKKSEKMPRPAEELRKTETKEDIEARRLAALEKRRERAAIKEQLRKETVVLKVPEGEKACPACGGTCDRAVGGGKSTTTIEYVPGYFIQREHIQETLACRCGERVVTAPPPPRPLDKSLYGAGFIAYIITMKCGDSLPLYRLAKQFLRMGVPIVRSTLTDLFHRAADKLKPLYERLLRIVAYAEIVQADETPLLMQRPHKKGFMWTFLTSDPAPLIVYRFSSTRSGETPSEVLGSTRGQLVVDAYSGYNHVTQPEGRERDGCLAHVRRYFFEALATSPAEARRAMDLILPVYRVEHEATARGITRTPEHLSLRQSRSREAMNTFHAWLLQEQPNHLPKSPLGEAIRYTLNQWSSLVRFLDDARIPVDNNRAEGALRIVALGRKNFLFVGDEDNGANLAGLYSLVATCEANSVDPIAYLTDVLMRIDDHPNKQLDELLPHKWRPPTGAGAPT